MEFFSFELLHYHVDPRFLTRSQRNIAGRACHATDGRRNRVNARCQSAPISKLTTREIDEIGGADPPITPALRRRKCLSTDTEFQFFDKRPIAALQRAYSDHLCGGKPGAWICPHRGAPLVTIEPVDGVLTCPLHGLRIDAESGTVLAHSR